MGKEKLTKTVGAFKVCEEDKKQLQKIMDIKDRTECQVIRYMISATVKRFRAGKVKDEDLY